MTSTDSIRHYSWCCWTKSWKTEYSPLFSFYLYPFNNTMARPCQTRLYLINKIRLNLFIWNILLEYGCKRDSLASVHVLCVVCVCVSDMTVLDMIWHCLTQWIHFQVSLTENFVIESNRKVYKVRELLIILLWKMSWGEQWILNIFTP